MSFAPYFLSALFISVLTWMYMHHYRRTMAGRASLLDSCKPLLRNAMVGRNEDGYATLEGLYEGYRVRLTLEEDHLAMRKIPSLWLHLLIESDQPVTVGTLGMLVRPQNTEFYSPSWNWEKAVPPPPGWPQHAIYRTRGVLPDIRRMDAHVRKMFEDEKAKELVVTPRRIRLTYQAKQAERGDYLLLRSATFDHDPLSPETVDAMLRHGIGLCRDLEGVAA
jgi:hypothetical protein